MYIGERDLELFYVREELLDYNIKFDWKYDEDKNVVLMMVSRVCGETIEFRCKIKKRKIDKLLINNGRKGFAKIVHRLYVDYVYGEDKIK